MVSPSSSQIRPVLSGSGPVPPPAPPERPVHGTPIAEAPSVSGSGSGSHGSHGKSTPSGGVSLTRLFKAAASKV